MLARLGLLLTLAIALSSCQPEKKETTTRGNLTVLIAESVAPVMIEEVNQFLSIYSKNGANIWYEVVWTEEAIRRFVQDTIRCVVSTRALMPGERTLLKSTPELELTEIPVAHDGIVVVVHHKNQVGQITTTELRNILTGSITRWEQLSRSKGMKGRIEVLYDDSSDASHYLSGRILEGRPLRKDTRRSTSSLQTLKSVVESPLSLACVGLNWLDSARVPAKALEIGETTNPTDTTYQLAPESLGKFYSPHPAHIYRKYYPLRRTIYLYARAPVGTLAGGFSTFVANKEGQRIFLSKNLVPGTQPIRLRAPQ